MSRYKKFIKSEKAKTKLKGAKLPKGLNVTKTDFKIKKIVIREQIRDTSVIEDGAVIRSQNIKVSSIKMFRIDQIVMTLTQFLGTFVKTSTSQRNKSK